jgi:hypothetical protein
LIITQSTPSPDRWVPLQRDSNANTYIDALTVETEGNYRRVWERIEFATPRPNGTSTLMARYELDCARRTMQTLSLTGWNRQGHVVSTSSDPGSIDPVVPETNSETFLNFMCRAQLRH